MPNCSSVLSQPCSYSYRTASYDITPSLLYAQKDYIQTTSISQLHFLNKDDSNIYFIIFLVRHTTKTNVLLSSANT